MKNTQLKDTFILIFFAMCIACEQKVESPVVEAVYPSSDTVPENLLRMYIKFSKPMKTKGNLEKIKLIDEKGNEVKNVFFNNVYELWNKEQTQLTLILDPSRVKTGLQPNQSLGRAIKPDHHYTLIVKNLEDVNHQRMQASFKKKISVEKADFQMPDINKWELIIPKVASKEIFIVRFPQMLDYLSLKQRLIITNSDKKPLDGSVSIENQETEWHFTPSESWAAGDYLLYINARLEDPAGNNLNGLFDHKTGSLKYKQEGEILMIPFQIQE